jgi:8-oxo-dGTP pyrophosphatase MutT (NUDIX family)
MALPGGRRDPADADLLGTATRETLEETGVDLERDGFALGRLEVVAPSTPRLPKLTISPFVFGLSAEADAWVASPEVEQVFWVRVDELRAAQAHSTVNVQFPGGSRAFPCYRVAGEIVWGLTYRILHQFLRVYPEGEPEGV